jgi:hypothetical protein
MSTLPDWLPLEAWEGFVAMRKKIKKPLATERATSLAIGTLDKLRAEGQDVAAVLDQSTMNSWMGLFPISERRAESRPQPSRFPALGKAGQATANNLQDWLEDFA